MSNTTDEYWSILTSINEWIRFSDLKAGVIISIYGVLFTIVYSNPSQVFGILKNNDWIFCISILVILVTITSIILAFLSLNPFLKNKNPSSVIYFGHIQEAFKNHKKYHEKASKVFKEKSDHELQLAEQVYINSKICWRKFKFVTWSIRFFVGSLGLLFIEILIYLAQNL